LIINQDVFSFIKTLKKQITNSKKETNILIYYSRKINTKSKIRFFFEVFEKMENLRNKNEFQLIRVNKTTYKNSFFILKKGTLIFKSNKQMFLNILEKLKKILINKPLKINNKINNHKIEIHDILNNKIKDPRYYAMIHNTHSNSKGNKNKTILFNVRSFHTFDIFGVLLSQNKIHTPLYQNKKYLFIVENYKIFELENNLKYYERFVFTEGQETSSNFLNKNKREIDILHGSGRQINTSYLTNEFLGKYKKIFYFGDYDDSGYQIFEKFKNEHKSLNIEYMLPQQNIINNIQEIMNDYRIITIRDNIDEKINKIKNKNLLKKLRLNEGFEMQQEVFLVD